MDDMTLKNVVRLAVVAAAAAFLMGCAHTSVPARPQVGPDMSGVLRLGTRFGAAHGCPISPTLALTSAHVVDPRPFDPAAPMFGAVATTEFKVEHVTIRPVKTFPGRDLALLYGRFDRWFPIAKEAPEAGLPVYALGYNYEDSAHAFEPKTNKMVALRRLGGRLLMTGDDPRVGSSGGCVLNALSEVVAVIEGHMVMDNDDKVVLAVEVWGETFEWEPPPAEEEEKTELDLFDLLLAGIK